jgi:DNA-damage-inducible protein D
MNNLTLSTSETQIDSPFDAIRGYRADGGEYWTARELMRWLGFSHWQTFEGVVGDAIADIELLDAGSAIEHITQVRKSPQSGGRDMIDYNLSRLGCYHVALACKQRTIEVAAARRYFAVKTREAELKPKTNIQMLVEVAQEMARQEQVQIAQAKEIELIKQRQALEAARIDELAQLTQQHDAEIDRIYSPNGHYFSVIGYARNRGLLIGIVKRNLTWDPNLLNLRSL